LKKLFVLFIIKLYKITLSKIFYAIVIRCKYYPTCSEYTAQAIQKYGCIK